MPQPYWTNRPARTDETAAILRLVRAVHGDQHVELNERYWMWRYLNDCGFRAEIVMAEHEGEPIGIQPVAPFDWQWQELRCRGMMYTGVLTHPNHRRRGVFRSLIDSSNQHSAKLGALFSMTMPNDASLPGFIRFRDWTYPGSIPLWFKVIDGPAMLRPKTGRAIASLFGPMAGLCFRRRRLCGSTHLNCEPTTVVPDELDKVFDRFARDCGALMLRRTAKYWNWRYGARPGGHYRTLLLRDGGAVAGAVATSVGRRMGLDIGMIVDLLAAGGVPVLRRLLWEAEAELRTRGLGLVTCQATSALVEQALSEEGYRRPPPGWLPKKFHFVYRPTGLPGLPKLPASPADWHLTFGDSDNA